MKIEDALLFTVIRSPEQRSHGSRRNPGVRSRTLQAEARRKHILEDTLLVNQLRSYFLPNNVWNHWCLK